MCSSFAIQSRVSSIAGPSSSGSTQASDPGSVSSTDEKVRTISREKGFIWSPARANEIREELYYSLDVVVPKFKVSFAETKQEFTIDRIQYDAKLYAEEQTAKSFQARSSQPGYRAERDIPEVLRPMTEEEVASLHAEVMKG